MFQVSLENFAVFALFLLIFLSNGLSLHLLFDFLSTFSLHLPFDFLATLNSIADKQIVEDCSLLAMESFSVVLVVPPE